MNKNIVIIHYNTPHLTECLVRSINMFVDNAIIYIFDNSDRYPFTAEFDNVTLFDNTKGQIINFDKWLENYPKRFKSTEATKMFGSAKHCYSVEKCIELVDENFILLDSDVLLKRDISCLYDDRAIYIGEIIKQPYVSVKRVLPFVCFINVEMMKKYGKHYFDDNYMHGLYNNKINEHADWYDTGAGFYINTLDLPHMDIVCEDYVVHYGHGSWFKEGYSYNYTAEEWLAINKRFWSKMKNNKVVYTCITGDYDTLIEPRYVTEGFDYVCFTDNPSLTSNTWDIRPIPQELESLSKVKQQRYIKINAHKFFSEYTMSIWVDGNITIKGDLNEFIGLTLTGDTSVYVPQHPLRNCLYDEAKAVVSMKKDAREIVNPQIERYKAEGFPKDYGLLQSNILLRMHNDNNCIRLMEAWFDELKDNSHRDQLSFNYALWKNSDVSVIYMDKDIFKSKWFFWNTGHKKTYTVSKPNTKETMEELKRAFKETVGKKRNNKINTFNVSIY